MPFNTTFRSVQINLQFMIQLIIIIYKSFHVSSENILIYVI